MRGAATSIIEFLIVQFLIAGAAVGVVAAGNGELRLSVIDETTGAAVPATMIVTSVAGSIHSRSMRGRIQWSPGSRRR